MLKMKRIVSVLLTLVLMTGVAACSKTSPPETQQAPKVDLTVSAAASLTDAMKEIISEYGKENSNVTIEPNFNSSGALEQQIENGADADLFVSAAAKQMDQLKTKGLIMEDTSKNLLENKLVLIVPKDSTIDLHDFQGVTGSSVKKLAVGEFKSVPAGQYAEQVFTKLNILDQVKAKAVYGKDVKAVLAWVESGDADAGVVYATDAAVSNKVKVVAVAAEDTHKPIIYPAAVIKSSKNPDAAKAFLNYLSGEKARSIFEKNGFTVIAK